MGGGGGRVIGTAGNVCGAGSMQLSGVRPSVRLSVPSCHRTPLLRVCCCGPGGREISICYAAGGQQQRAAARRAAANAGVPELTLEAELVTFVTARNRLATKCVSPPQWSITTSNY